MKVTVSVNILYLYIISADSLTSHSWTTDSAGEIMFNLRGWFSSLVVLATVYAGVTALFSFFVVLGVCCEVSMMCVSPCYIASFSGSLLAGSVPHTEHG